MRELASIYLSRCLCAANFQSKVEEKAFSFSMSDAGLRITVLGASALASCLEKNSTLTNISLSNQRIGDAGAEALAR